MSNLEPVYASLCAPGSPFELAHEEVLGEIRDCIDTVRGDLLSDMIDTLHAAATSSQALAKRRWRERQRCIAAVIG